MWKLELIAAIVLLVESYLEHYVIKLKSPSVEDYTENNKLEHRWSFIYSAFVVLGYLWLTGYWILIGSLFLSRRIFFDYPLKLFRKKDIRNIEGDQFWDNLSRRVFGKQGGLIEAVAVILLKIIYITLCVSFSGT